MENLVSLAGLSLLLITGIRLWRRSLRGATRLDVFMPLLGGFALNAGLIGRGLHSGGTFLGGLIESATAMLFGAGLPILLVVGMAALMVIDVRDRSIWPFTPIIAALFATAMNVVGGLSTETGVVALEVIGQGMTALVEFFSFGWVA